MFSWYHKFLAGTTSLEYMPDIQYHTMSEMFELDKIQSRAYLMINCESGAEEHVLDEIRTFPQIKESTLTIGKHDILALVETGSADELREVIVLKIRKIPEVRCTTTLVCMRSA